MRRALLDTHAVLWWLGDDPALSPKAREAIGDPQVETLVSIASVWEIAIKRAIGKLRAPQTLLRTIEDQGFTWLGIGPRDAWSVAELPDHHRDPFDRLLIAQAIGGRLPVITADPTFAPYGVEVLW